MKTSKTYPTSDEVWLHAREADLVIDKIPEESGDRHMLDQEYAIKECQPDGEDPKAMSGRRSKPPISIRFSSDEAK